MKRLLPVLLLIPSLTWAADSRITDLTELTDGNVATGDFVPCVDVSDTTDNAAGSSRKCAVSALARAVGGRAVYTLGSDYTNSTTTGTSITGLGTMAVGAAGTYHLQCVLLVQSAATTTSPKFGINYTGTTTLFSAHARFPSEGVTAATGQLDNSANATTGHVWAYSGQDTAATTAPNLGPWTGVTTANANIMLHLESLMVVSTTGTIEVWAGSEVAASQITVKAGSYCAVETL